MGATSFTEYDDDGVTELYRSGEFTSTLIEQNCDAKGNVTVTINPTKGNFNGFVKEKVTVFKVNASAAPKKVAATVNGKKIKLKKAKTIEDFNNGENVWFYDAQPNLNRFATKTSGAASISSRVSSSFSSRARFTTRTSSSSRITMTPPAVRE